MTLDDLISRNPGVDPERLGVGQALIVGAGLRRTVHRIRGGDTVSALAARYRVSAAELRRWNPGLNADRLRVGRELAVFTERPASYSESIGQPNRGRLLYGARLPLSRSYRIRDRARAWGTEEAVESMVSAFEEVYNSYPRSPRVMIHDLSQRQGGWMSDHHSHQSGRDADIALYRRDCRGACEFGAVGPRQLDLDRQWALFEHWLRRNQVEAIFVDYELQKPLYRHAQQKGATREQLLRWFQYPNGKGSPLGVIRHFRKHADHAHVRFACHRTDGQCRSFRPLLMKAGDTLLASAP